MRECARCGRYMLALEVHHCLPAFKVWITAYNEEDGATTVYASDAESAAREYLEGYDHEGHLGPYEVAVVDHKGVRSLCKVRGEETIHWSAEVVEVSNA